ncbi:DUF2812 domain-containing protein [Facklamia miroungae]|uniref:DUF2812 domain-containing protein n=1 Tax=Facklamia miroungae TaxID=120956 RepID=A0A1G7QCD6_9LACT|nr:DUF2812 domain-containing protein [Facklamia miroungae]NKZ28898.1 DUF2812 domain-containing protein [Facklamia miroungae]SDF96183.1 Protein of unknown function [Facklamia miroungae]
MRKIKFFADPIKDIKIWLNQMSEKGYKLVALHHCIYDFEKTNQRYYYETQYIGGNAYEANQKYISMLKESNKELYRTPINQGNLTPFKFRLRPFAEGSGKFANTFMDYNKEILIIGSLEKEELFTDYSDIAIQYKKSRNAYLQGVIMLLILFAMSIKKIIENNGWSEITLAIIAGLFLVYFSYITFKNHQKYKDYLSCSLTQER